MKILTNKLRNQLEEYSPMADEQAGFRKDRSTIQQILMVRMIAERQREKTEQPTTALSTWAFDSVEQKIIWATFGYSGLEDRLVQTLQNAGKGSKAAVKIGNEWFNISIGTK